MKHGQPFGAIALWHDKQQFVMQGHGPDLQVIQHQGMQPGTVEMDVACKRLIACDHSVYFRESLRQFGGQRRKRIMCADKFPGRRAEVDPRRQCGQYAHRGNTGNLQYAAQHLGLGECRKQQKKRERRSKQFGCIQRSLILETSPVNTMIKRRPK